MIWLFRALGSLPLWLNHGIGFVLGWLAWLGSGRHRRLTRENVRRYVQHAQAHHANALLRAAISEQGKGITELATAWTSSPERLYGLVRECIGWEHVEAAQAIKQPIIFVTPHLGCYDIAGRYMAGRMPITALYSPPKQAWLAAIMQQGRVRAGGTTAAADASGIRALLRALKRGGNIVVLPDQVPGGGDGVWVDFFGQPAYTMTLLPRLAASAGAVVLFFFAERLPHGNGYRMHIESMSQPFSTDREVAARQTNDMIEKLVGMAPAQYLWGYNRYKHPAGAPMPEGR
ncbi:MAG: lysophospholipid acyltransferase family protein [Burkholderiales bacterium]|nr:lysophospholipid acyltransferase family protein [Burkholderiales bacterium]